MALYFFITATDQRKANFYQQLLNIWEPLIAAHQLLRYDKSLEDPLSSGAPKLTIFCLWLPAERDFMWKLFLLRNPEIWPDLWVAVAQEAERVVQ